MSTAADSELFAAVINEMGDGILILDYSGTILFSNKSSAQMLSLGSESTYILPELNNGRAELSTKDAHEDTQKILDVLVTPIQWRDGKAKLAVFRDITHQKRLQERKRRLDAQMARARRMEAAGTVAGQIAHDFNNLLTPLLAYPPLIRKRIPDDEMSIELLDTMIEVIQQMRHLNQQFLNLARRGKMESARFNVNEAIRDVVQLLEKEGQFGEINIKMDLADNLFDINGNIHQLSRVLQNLVNNAADAMDDTSEDKTITLRTENIYMDQECGDFDVVAKGEYVRITISDNGSGMPENIREHIFDPFFTTKKELHRRGSGLGLSIVHGIIKDHRGDIDLVSEEGVGTTFRIFIPSFRQDNSDQNASEDALDTRGHVLVVDDDDVQIRLLRRILTTIGYTSDGVTNSEQALSFLEDCSADIVLLDVVLDIGLNGVETCRQIRVNNPSQSIVLMSGKLSPEEDGLPLPEGVPFLQKPFTRKILESTLNSFVQT